jgi:tetratricopeptide (TPR) repeat protein
MWRFWQKRGHLYEARRRLEAIAAEPWSRTDPVLRARLMEALGGVLWWQADIASMKVAYREALDIWRGIGDRAEIANALYNYSFSFSVAEDPLADPEGADPDGEGRAAQAEAYAIYREIGDLKGQANVVWGMGNAEYFAMTGDHGEPRFREALDLFRAVHDITMEAWSLHMLGSALLRQGRSDEAGEILRHALRHFYDASDAAGMALVFDDLHSHAVSEGTLERAARIYGVARRLTAATGAELAGYVDTQFEHQLRPHINGRLAPEALEKLMGEGAAMTLDDAVAYALGITPDELRESVHGPDPAG